MIQMELKECLNVMCCGSGCLADWEGAAALAFAEVPGCEVKLCGSLSELEAGHVVAVSVEAAPEDDQPEEESESPFARCSRWTECGRVVGTR